MPTVITYAVEVLNALPQLIVAGVDILQFLHDSNSAIKKMQVENRDPTNEEWDALNKIIEDLRAQRPDVG